MLYLVRHGQARAKEEDPARPLSDAGVASARRLARFIRHGRRVSVGEVRHSTKLRARQTAEILAAEGGLEVPVREAANLEPLDEVDHLAEALGAEEGDLMLVGHLPHLDRLASVLVAGDPDLEAFAFRECTMLCLEPVAAAGGGTAWTVRWMLDPALLPA